MSRHPSGQEFRIKYLIFLPSKQTEETSSRDVDSDRTKCKTAPMQFPAQRIARFKSSTLRNYLRRRSFLLSHLTSASRRFHTHNANPYSKQCMRAFWMKPPVTLFATPIPSRLPVSLPTQANTQQRKTQRNMRRHIPFSRSSAHRPGKLGTQGFHLENSRDKARRSVPRLHQQK